MTQGERKAHTARLQTDFAMNARRCLKIANRMDSLLKAELGLGVDPARMVADALYARDVLLVCEGFGSGELPQLAHMYRWAATTPPAESKAGPASVPAPATTRAPGRKAGRISGFFGSIFAPSTHQ